jgi:hypothetical protein
MNLSVAKQITDEGWRDYLNGTLLLAKNLGHAPSLSMMSCLHAYPNAVQRQMASDFIAQNNVRQIDRVAVLTDSALLRGAMTAFGWLMPKMRVRAFSGDDSAGALRWLREAGAFDESQAMDVWNEAHAKLAAKADTRS